MPSGVYVRKPRESLYHHVCVRIPREDMSEVRKLAKKEDVSIAEKIRTYIVWGIENEK